jgi:hypothetical protein
MQSYHYPTDVFIPDSRFLHRDDSQLFEIPNIGNRFDIQGKRLPPRFIDPILQNSQVNLSGIVNDVMGPSSYEHSPGAP